MRSIDLFDALIFGLVLSAPFIYEIISGVL